MMLKKSVLALALAMAPLAATADDHLTIETYRGPVQVAPSPEKIAVFDMAALDVIDALGIKPIGTAQPVIIDYLLDTVEGTENIGTVFEPDYETIAALQLDLIVAGGRSHKVVPNLSELAPTVDMTIWEDTVGQGLERLAALGKVFGKEAKAAELADAFQAKLDAAQSAIAGKGTALIVMTNGPKVSAYGAAGRFGWLHNTIGLPEAVEAVEQATHGEAISFEFIRDADPDILIVIDRQAAIGQDSVSAKTTLDNALVHETKAWKNNKVIYLDPAAIYVAGGGIQSMMRTLDQFITAFEHG